MRMLMSMIMSMRSVNALAVRKGLGAVLDEMQTAGEPVLVTRDREPVAALVPIAIFRQRFVDFMAADAIDRAMEELAALQIQTTGDSLSDLRALRDG